ncbi:MAG: hypothetical protein J7J06_03620 [Methanosarcinales archaeon]|nr:hypothetical protein [Methanosarcinales archaeon]
MNGSGSLQETFRSRRNSFFDLCPETVSAIIAALPITGAVNRWGDEIYFSISVTGSTTPVPQARSSGRRHENSRRRRG